VHPTLGANVEYGLAINAISKAPWDERGVGDERAFYSGQLCLAAHGAEAATSPTMSVRSKASPSRPTQVVSTGSPLGGVELLCPAYGHHLGRLRPHRCAHRAVCLRSDKKNWRIGHFWRDVPADYGESISQERNLNRRMSMSRVSTTG